MIDKDIEGVYLYIKHAPRNPNVNGIYYDEESYRKVLNDYIKNVVGTHSAVAMFGYPTKGLTVESIMDPYFIGKIVELNDDIVVIKPSKLVSSRIIKDIRNNQSNYWFGFTFEAELKDNVAYISKIKTGHVFKAPAIKNIKIEVEYDDRL